MLSAKITRFLGPLLVSGFADVDVVLGVTQRPVDDLGEFACDGEDCESETDGPVSLTDAIVSESDGLVSLTGAIVSETDGLVSLTDAIVSESDGLVSLTGAIVSESDGLVSLTGAIVSESDGLVSLTDAIVSESDGLVSLTGAIVSESDAPVSLIGAIVSESEAGELDWRDRERDCRGSHTMGENRQDRQGRQGQREREMGAEDDATHGAKQDGHVEVDVRSERKRSRLEIR